MNAYHSSFEYFEHSQIVIGLFNLEVFVCLQVEDMVSVMDELLEKFMEEIIPIAVDVADRLVRDGDSETQ